MHRIPFASQKCTSHAQRSASENHSCRGGILSESAESGHTTRILRQSGNRRVSWLDHRLASRVPRLFLISLLGANTQRSGASERGRYIYVNH